MRLCVLVLAAALAAANFLPTKARAEGPPSPETMQAAQALFTHLFAHGFVALNAQAVETAWPGIAKAFAVVLPRMQSMTADTQESFLKLLRERGLLN